MFSRARSGAASSLALVCSFLLACGGAEVPEIGEVDLALVGTTSSGAVYRLRDARFSVRGREVVTIAAGDFPANADTIGVPLAAGAYTITLESGWTLARVEGSTETAVRDARLVSTNPASFAVAEGIATPVTFRFETAGEPLELTPGSLAIDISVDEGPLTPTASSRVALADGAWLTQGTAAGLTYVEPGAPGVVALTRYDGTLAWRQTPTFAQASVDPGGRVALATNGTGDISYVVLDTRGAEVARASMPTPGRRAPGTVALGAGEALAVIYDQPHPRPPSPTITAQRVILGRTSTGTPYRLTLDLPREGVRPRASFDAAGNLWVVGSDNSIGPIIRVDATGSMVSAMPTDVGTLPRDARIAPDGLGGVYVAYTTEQPSLVEEHRLARYEAGASTASFVRRLSPITPPAGATGTAGAPVALSAGPRGEAVVQIGGAASYAGGPRTQRVLVFRASGLAVLELDAALRGTIAATASAGSVWVAERAADGAQTLSRYRL